MNNLLNKGHQVIFWTSNFDHGLKKKYTKIKKKKNFIYNNIISYKTNLSLLRNFCHIQLCLKLYFYLKNNEFDLILISSIPPELLLAVKNKKFIVDIRDIWPDALNNYKNKKLLFFLFKIYCDIIYNYTLPNALGFTTVATSYSSWLFRYTCRQVKFSYFPLGVREIPKFNKSEIKFKFGYAGGLTPQFNLQEFANFIKNGEGLCLIGTGPLYNKYQELFPKAKFFGHLSREHSMRTLSSCEYLLFPSNKSARLPNKFFDYLSLQKKIIFGRDISIDIKNIIMDEKLSQYYGFLCLSNFNIRQLYKYDQNQIYNNMTNCLISFNE